MIIFLTLSAFLVFSLYIFKNFETIIKNKETIIKNKEKMRKKDMIEMIESRINTEHQKYYNSTVDFAKTAAIKIATTIKENDDSFKESINLLRDLADIQNDAPLETSRKEWEEIMTKTYDFLEKYEK